MAMKNLHGDGGRGVSKRDYEAFCWLQGIELPLELPDFTLKGRCKAVGNAVPLPMPCGALE